MSSPHRAPRLTGLAPAIGSNARVLVLGSMPGAESLRLQQYYAHPRNAFWRIVDDVFAIPQTVSYALRMTALNDVGIAVWDVLAECRRRGSLDAAIDPDSVRPNNVAGLLRAHLGIARIVLNGGLAAKAFKTHIATDRAIPETIEVIAMPSTSPANAAMTYAEKLARWRTALVG